MEVNQRKLGVILSYIAIVINAIIGFFYVPLLLFYLGPNEYGLYQLLGAMVAYFAIMDFGLSATIIRFYSKYVALKDYERVKNLLGISRIIYYLLSGLTIMAGYILYINIDNIFFDSLSSYELIESKKIFILLLLNIVITLLANIYNSIITANEKFVFLKTLTIIQILLQPFIVVALISVSPKAFTMTLILTVFNFFASLVKLYYCKVILKVEIKYSFFDRTLIISMVKFSLSIFTVTIVDQIFWRSNQIILGIINGTASVALYSIAAQIYMNYMPLSTVIQGVFLPKITQLYSNKTSDQDLSNMFIRIGKIQYMLLSFVLFGFILYGKEFITIWVGSKYIEAYWITILILIPFTIELMQNIGLTIMQAKNKYSFRAKLYTLMAIFNLALSWILSIHYGAIGAAFATGLVLILGNGLVMNIYYYKKLGINIPLFWKGIGNKVPSLTVTIILCIILKKFYVINDLTALVISGLIFCIVYSVFLWVIGMDMYEKSILKNLYKKLFKRNLISKGSS